MVRVATHDGQFHADEVFAVAILRMVYDEVDVVRTREADIYSKADMRVDVGLKNSPETDDYDHHQMGGAGKRGNGIPYASAGLVWRHFGMKLVDSEDAFRLIDDMLMAPLDAGDNGVSTYEAKTVNPFLLSDVIEAYNPLWNEDRDSDIAFEEAVNLAMSLMTRIIRKAHSIVAAGRIVDSAERFEGGRIIVLEESVPWERHVIKQPDALFVVLPDNRKGWYVYTVPVEIKSFTRRRYLPASWAALRDDGLAEETGVDDAYFCHKDRFIAGARTKQGAIALAKLALKE